MTKLQKEETSILSIVQSQRSAIFIITNCKEGWEGSVVSKMADLLLLQIKRESLLLSIFPRGRTLTISRPTVCKQTLKEY